MKRTSHPVAHRTLAAMAFLLAVTCAEAQTPRPAEERPARAVEPTEATLNVRTNAACELQVGKLPKRTLLPDAPQPITVVPGETAIECTSTTVPGAEVKVVRHVPAGAKETVELDVAEQVVAKSCSGKPATLADLGGGLLRHCVSKHDWAQADNGSDVDWAKAQAACTAKGDSWELPAANELSELIDRSGRSQTTCGSAYRCNVSPHFKLTAPTFWAKEDKGHGLRMMVSLLLGGQHPSVAETARGYRALCVRSR